MPWRCRKPAGERRQGDTGMRFVRGTVHAAGVVREPTEAGSELRVRRTDRIWTDRETFVNQGRAGITRPGQQLEAGWSRSPRGEGWQKKPERVWDRAQVAPKELARN